MLEANTQLKFLPVGTLVVPTFSLYNSGMDSDDESLKILDDELKESERDGEEMLACGN